jgi:molybdopterin/thiamine biosynthesis adenylyltransferase
MTLTALAEALQCRNAQITKWKSQGMPTNSPEAAAEWLAAQGVKRRRPHSQNREKMTAPALENLERGAKARLERAAEGEARHYELWKAAAYKDKLDSKVVAELATSWRDMRKAASTAETEYHQFCAQNLITLNRAETLAAFRALISSAVQDFSTRPWGEEARAILNRHLVTLPAKLKLEQPQTG